MSSRVLSTSARGAVGGWLRAMLLASTALIAVTGPALADSVGQNGGTGGNAPNSSTPGGGGGAGAIGACCGRDGERGDGWDHACNRSQHAGARMRGIAIGGHLQRFG